VTGAAEGEGRPAEGGWRPACLPPDLIERLAAVAVHAAHEAADVLAVAALLPIPEWSAGMYGTELQCEMDAVPFEWPDISDAQLQQVRQITGTAFERQLAQLTSNANLGSSA